MPESKFDLGDYVEVRDRIARFYDLFGQGRLVTERVELTREPDDKPKVIVYALAYRTPDDPHPGTGSSWLYLPGTTNYTRGSELENAETSAWGRAIGSLGILIDRSIASANEIKSKGESTRTDAGGGIVNVADSYPAGDWQAVGTAQAGKPPYDAELRVTPDGGVFGFRIETAEKKGYAVLAEGPLALPVSLVWSSFAGQTIRVSGPSELVKWSKLMVNGKSRNMPPYRLIRADHIESDEIIIPAPPDGPLQRLEDEDAAAKAEQDRLADRYDHEAMSSLGLDEEAELDAIAETL